jgi:hypothetical protein
VNDTPVNDACDASTFYRIRRWFKKKIGSLIPGLLKMRQARHPLPGDSPPRPLDELKKKPGWLGRIVADLANHGLWPQTHLAWTPQEA